MYLDIKNTIWERIEIQDENQYKEVLKKLESGEFTSGSDVADYLDDCSAEYLYDTATEMDIEGNKGFSTLELYNEENEITFQNGK